LAQARKTTIRKDSQIPAHVVRRLQESLFLFAILLAVYLLACLVTYDPLDPGPFNTTASDQVQNMGRILGAWLANFFLFLTGYVAYLLPPIVVYGGWSAYSQGAGERFLASRGWSCSCWPPPDSATCMCSRPPAACPPAVAVSSASRWRCRWSN